jgi:hypothetical protein
MSGPSDAQRTYGAAVAKEIAKSVMEAETKNLPKKIFTPDQIKQIDKWIRGQNDSSLDRIEAIRRLVEIGLKAKAKGPTMKPVNPKKETKTAEELAAMILQDLSNVEGCPRRGVTVTIYGLDPWNVLLSFGVEAGRPPLQDDA